MQRLLFYRQRYFCTNTHRSFSWVLVVLPKHVLNFRLPFTSCQVNVCPKMGPQSQFRPDGGACDLMPSTRKLHHWEQPGDAAKSDRSSPINTWTLFNSSQYYTMLSSAQSTTHAHYHFYYFNQSGIRSSVAEGNDSIWEWSWNHINPTLCSSAHAQSITTKRWRCDHNV